MGNGAMTFEEVFTQAGIIPQWIERGREEGIKKGMEMGIEKGIEKGMEKGMEKGIVTTAKNALAKGYSIDDIHEITGLDIKAIKKLAAELQAGADLK